MNLHLTLRVFLPACCLLLFSLPSTAQLSWNYLPNIGLNKGSGPGDTAQRIEDVYFTDSLTGHAITLGNRILKTTDGGKHWTIKNDTTIPSLPRAIEFLDDGVTGIVGSLFGTTFRTTDAGETWTEITSAITDLYFPQRRICGLAHAGNTFYGVGWWGSQIARFFKSTDKGVTWTTSYLDTNLATSLVDVTFLSEDTGFVTGARATSNGQFLMATESAILRTTDGGATWTKVFSDTTIGGRIWKIQFVDRLIGYGSIEPYYTFPTDTTYKGSVNIVKTTDGGLSWQIIHAAPSGVVTGLHNTGNQGVGFINKDTGWAGGYYNGVFETRDGGQTWAYLAFGQDFNRFFVVNPSLVFAGGRSVYKFGRPEPTRIREIPASRLPHTLHPVAPNPSRGHVKIAFDLSCATHVRLEVANLEGKRVYLVASGFFKAGRYEYSWDGKDAPAGNYLIWLGTNEIPISGKFTLIK